MTSLFSQTKRKALPEENETEDLPISLQDPEVSSGKVQSKYQESYSFQDLGLIDWICQTCRVMGFKRPTPIQQACIPAILEGRNVMGCAETGSGKTAAFALPMLQQLSEDPYGIFGIILTPTRELAVQIQEQVIALGAPISVRTCLVIGGLGIIDQGTALSRRPHLIIATPGRLRHHLESADPPDISRARFLVLDEADRLLSIGFESELLSILNRMTPPRRQTLLFSATLTTSLEQLEDIASLNGTLRFDLTSDQKIPSTLSQQYLFIPSQVKLCYLVTILKKLYEKENENDSDDEDKRSKKKRSKKRISDQGDGGGSDSIVANGSSTSFKSSIIIFTSSCKRCQIMAEILLHFGIDCVALHSLLSQSRRAASLGKFKNQMTKILVATDIASRGLDIPQVNLVINLDIPKIPSDYVHRVGRTARAGRSGRALSLISPQEVSLIHDIEEFTNQKMLLSEEVTYDDVIPLLNPVAKAIKVAELRMMEVGFDEIAQKKSKQKRKQNRKSLRKIWKNKSEEQGSSGGGTGGGD
jgi:ATP-dependent RNA helicase DDX49/DBP8